MSATLQTLNIIVFKPGLVQDLGLSFDRVIGFWLGHQVGRVNFYFKKIQNGIVLVKKKKSMDYNQVAGL